MSELRPCPFCNQELKRRNLSGGEIEFSCGGNCMMTTLTTIFPSDFIKDWNSAWCWKEIDRLRELVRVKDEALREIAEMKGKTLLGCQHDEYHRECEGREAHEVGANKAFNQTANIAEQALKAGEGK